MNLQTVHVKAYGELSIGDCVAAELLRLSQESDAPLRIIAVVPRMVAYFQVLPRRYAVTEVDIILEV